jgi:biopolymer transport protein ExbD
MKLNRIAESRLAVQVSPLIDVVFLLLIYFMVTALLIKREGDVAFTLPGGTGNDVPIEVVVEIRADGSIEFDGLRFSSDDKPLEALIAHVSGLKQMAVSQRAEFFVNLLPHRDALHGRIINVMDACTTAGAEKLLFSKSI